MYTSWFPGTMYTGAIVSMRERNSFAKRNSESRAVIVTSPVTQTPSASSCSMSCGKRWEIARARKDTPPISCLSNPLKRLLKH